MKQLHLVQGPADVLEKLTSITEVQTKGRKRMSQTNLEYLGKFGDESPQLNSNKFIKIKRKIQKCNTSEMRVQDHNVLGFEVRP